LRTSNDELELSRSARREVAAMATYLKAVCECNEWSETNLVVVEDVTTTASFLYFIKRRWRLNQRGFGWGLADAVLLFATGGIWLGVILGLWLVADAYPVGGYLRCVECGSSLAKSVIRLSQAEQNVTTETPQVADTSLTSKLNEAAELHSKGILSDEEFQALKSRILKT
jgi:hypothetical protein